MGDKSPSCLPELLLALRSPSVVFLFGFWFLEHNIVEISKEKSGQSLPRNVPKAS